MTARSNVWKLVSSLILLALAAGCGIPIDSAPKPITHNQAPTELLNPTATSTTTTLPEVTVSETVYFVAPDQHVVGVKRNVALPADMGTVINALLDGPTAPESAAGIGTYLGGPQQHVTSTIQLGIAVIDFPVNPIQVVGSAQITAMAQLVYTVTSQPGVTGVVLKIAGQQTDVPVAGGALVSGPVHQSDYASVAPTAP